MDSITHIVLGACVGEAVAGQKVGKKALFIGAFAQSIPDFDFVTSFWMTPAQQLLAHRGITHSFLFILLIAPLLGLIMHRIVKRKISVLNCSLFLLFEMFIHLFLDAFNNYGVGWFEPFSHMRISFNTIYVADVLMTIVPVISFIALLLISSKSKNRARWARLAIAWSTAYLCVCIINKMNIDRQMQNSLKDQKIEGLNYFTTPAPLQSFLWMVVAGDGKGFYVGYRSVFDTDPKIKFTYFPSNSQLLDPIKDEEDVVLLKRFSQGFYTVEKIGDILVFNDLRFGQIIGWHDPNEEFVFHYFLHQPGNDLVVQRGRFAKWNRLSMLSFLKRIRGN
jgi:inner membrane protein